MDFSSCNLNSKYSNLVHKFKFKVIKYKQIPDTTDGQARLIIFLHRCPCAVLRLIIGVESNGGERISDVGNIPASYISPCMVSWLLCLLSFMTPAD